MHMPWGKHRGSPLEDVPTSYLAWVLEGANAPSPVLVREIKRELAKRLDVTIETPPRPSAHAAAVAVPSGLREAIDDIVASGFRAVAHERHPDHGGTSDAMRAALEARTWLRGVL